MFKKLLNVGKGHSNDKLQQQLQQQQQKNLFQFNEIKSYGFSKFTCLAYSPTLSLLAAGSSFGQLSVFGGPTVEFTYHLASSSDNGIRHIEFIDCRPAIGYQAPKSTLDKQAQQKDDTSVPSISVPAKLIVLTNTSHLHLFELRTCEPQNFADGTTQTDSSHQQQDCCSQQVSHPTDNGKPPQTVGEDKAASLRFTKLVHVGKIDYFKFKLGEDEDKSKRVTTIEICADNTSFLVGTESGNLYQVPLSKFEMFEETKKQQVAKHQAESANQQQQPSDLGTSNATSHPPSVATAKNDQQLTSNKDDAEETTAVNLNDEPQIGLNDDGDQASIANEELFDIIKYEDQIAAMLGDEIKPKKQGAIESIRRHPLSSDKILISYHRGLNVIYNLSNGTLEKYFYHNETIECSCFADQLGDFFYTSHTDGSYVRWDTRATGNQATANEESVAQLYGPYPCKPTPKIQACTGLVNDQLEDLIIFSGGMPRATYDDKHPVTIVHAGADGKDTIKKVLDFSSKVLDFVIITRPRGQLGAGAKSTGNTNLGSSAGATGGKKNKNKQQKEQAQLQQQQQRPIAVALAVLAEEEFVVIDLLNSESYLEFALPYLNCVHSSAITCSEHCSNVSGELYDQLLAYNKRESKGRLSPNGWPVTGGKVIDLQQTLIQPGDETGNAKAHDLLITGHEDGSINIWDVTELSMRHLIYLQTSRYFAVNEDDDLAMVDGGDSLANKPDHSGASAEDSSQHQQDASPNDNSTSDPSNGAETAWPPLKRVGRFDPFSDDTRLAVRKVRLCPQTGTLVIAGTGGQVLVFELSDVPMELNSLNLDHEIAIVQDHRFTWKGKGKLLARSGSFKFPAGSYQLSSYVQLDPPASPTSLDLRSDWRLFALGTSYGFVLYDYGNRQPVISRCTLNVQDFAIISGDAPGAGAMSRKKSFRKSLRESFRRLRRGRSQRNQPVTGPSSTIASATTGVANVQASSTVGEQAAPVRPAFNRLTTGVRTLNAPSQGADSNQSQSSGFPQVPRSVYANERQVEQKVDLGSIVKCITLTSCVITNTSPPSFTPSIWVGTNSGLVLIYAITLADVDQLSASASDETNQATTSSDEPASASPGDSATTSSSVLKTTAKLAKEIQLKHRAPIVAIFTSPEEPELMRLQQFSKQSTDDRSASSSKQSSPEKQASELMLANPESTSSQLQQADTSATDDQQAKDGRQTPSQQERVGAVSKQATIGKHTPIVQQQARVLICTEEQFKVFNLPNLKPFCKFKLTAHEGLRAKAISITQFLRPAASPVQQPQQQQATKQTGSSQLNLAASKSLQSFATQTSPPSSPIPPAEGGSEPGSSGQQNGPSTSLKQSESNNNSITALNKNHTSASKDLLNAKFGANSTVGGKVAAVERDQSQAVDGLDSGLLLEPYMVCMSNQGDCAVYSVPDLKRQAQIQVCRREDVNGIDSTMLTQYGEGFYLRSSLNFLRFSISSQRVLRSLALVS